MPDNFRNHTLFASEAPVMTFRTAKLPGFARSDGCKSPCCRNALTQRIHVSNNQVLGIWVLVIMVQVLGKYMTIRYLDPQGKVSR